MKHYTQRRYVVITEIYNEARVEALIEGDNALARAQTLVEKNKATLAKYGCKGSVWIRRIGHYKPVKRNMELATI